MDNDRKKIWLVVLIMAIVSIVVIGWNIMSSVKPGTGARAERGSVISESVVADDETETEVEPDGSVLLEPEEEGGHMVGYNQVDATNPDACPSGYVRSYMREHGEGDGTYFTVFALDCSVDASAEDVIVVESAQDGESTFKAKIIDAIPTNWKDRIAGDKWVQMTGRVHYDEAENVIWLENATLISISDVGVGDNEFQEAKTAYEAEYQQ